MSKKTKKPSITKSTKAKAPPKKAKPVANGKHPEAEMSASVQTALAAVAAMPVGKASKLDAVVELLKRPEGATIEDIIAVTGWQKHTVRAALSHALGKKRGYKIVSDKPQGGKRTYTIVEPAKYEH